MKQDLSFNILICLLRKGKHTVSQLANKFEVSKRTILRHIYKLDYANIPICTKTGKNGGIYISENFKLNSMFFKKDEFEKILSSLNSTYELLEDESLKNIIEKIEAIKGNSVSNYSLNTEQIYIDAGPWGDSETFKDKINVIKDAIFNRKLIEIEYHDRNSIISKRSIEPYTLVLKQGIWYVYAYCTVRKDFRLFKISRIKNMYFNGDTFQKRDFELKNAPFKNTWIDEKETINVSVRLEQRILSEIEEWFGIENVFKNEREQFIGNARFPYDDNLISKILSFGKDIEILEPLSLKIAIKKKISEISSFYSNI